MRAGTQKAFAMGESPYLEISTLGGLAIRLAGEPVTKLKTHKVESLLVYLACTGRTHPRETLAELFWEERSQAQSMTNLRGALSSLRKHLGDYLIITRDSVAMNPDAQIRLDTAVLEENLSFGQIEEAVALYQGDFLEGFFVRGCPGFEDWVSVERERLHRIVLDGLGHAVTACIAANECQEGITYASHILRLDPLMEEAHRQLMRLLTFSGQRSAALAQYEACRDLLAEELGAEPEPETVALYEEILAGDLTAPTGTAAPPPHNLPLQLTSFVGRESELAEFERLLGDPNVRLVTVVGAGGMGKTRLALEAAAAQLDRFKHGVFFVSLAPLRSLEGIVPTIADALGLTFTEGEQPERQLLRYLRRKQMLLVMDNYEHLFGRGGPGQRRSWKRSGRQAPGNLPG